MSKFSVTPKVEMQFTVIKNPPKEEKPKKTKE